jgi:hypothetical protein
LLMLFTTGKTEDHNNKIINGKITGKDKDND